MIFKEEWRKAPTGNNRSLCLLRVRNTCFPAEVNVLRLQIRIKPLLFDLPGTLARLPKVLRVCYIKLHSGGRWGAGVNYTIIVRWVSVRWLGAELIETLGSKIVGIKSGEMCWCSIISLYQSTSLSVSESVWMFPNSSETANPKDLKFWGMIPLGIRRTVSRKIACIVGMYTSDPSGQFYSLQYESSTYLRGW